jgi:hypothetical protein
MSSYESVNFVLLYFPNNKSFEITEKCCTSINVDDFQKAVSSNTKVIVEAILDGFAEKGVIVQMASSRDVLLSTKKYVQSLKYIKKQPIKEVLKHITRLTNGSNRQHYPSIRVSVFILTNHV